MDQVWRCFPLLISIVSFDAYIPYYFLTFELLSIQQAVDLMKEILPPELHAAAEELAEYFKESFGDKTRIDYGTGHETTFIAWLCCLEQ